MEAQTPLPLLFMRTVITALKAAPTLRPFIADLLSRLVSRSIWLDRNQWRGFVMLVENNGRAFFPVRLDKLFASMLAVIGMLVALHARFSR